MPQKPVHSGLFPALLKHWRNKRGLSQLDLALTADVSSRHISFLETGRSTPSAEMVLRLTAALNVPLRHVNTLLQSAGHEAIYPEPSLQDGIPPEIAHALQRMKTHQDPYPLVVIDRVYNIIDLNNGALSLFQALLPNLLQDPTLQPPNLARVTFHPSLKNILVNFEDIGRQFLWRIQREALEDPDDSLLRGLLNDLYNTPTVSKDWRQADLSVPSSPILSIHIQHNNHSLRFLTMVTAFQAPQTVLLDELRIETWFPMDSETETFCTALHTT